MKEFFGITHTGVKSFLYTICCGGITAVISDYGATLVKLFVPDRDGNTDDVILGHDSPTDYFNSTCFFGSTIGRSANRIRNASFKLNGKTYQLTPN